MFDQGIIIFIIPWFDQEIIDFKVTRANFKKTLTILSQEKRLFLKLIIPLKDLFPTCHLFINSTCRGYVDCVSATKATISQVTKATYVYQLLFSRTQSSEHIAEKLQHTQNFSRTKLVSFHN